MIECLTLKLLVKIQQPHVLEDVFSAMHSGMAYNYVLIIQILDVNIKAAAMLVKEAHPYLKKKG